MENKIKLKQQYNTNPYLQKVFQKESLAKWLGINANKSADEILDYVRKRKQQIGDVLEQRKDALSKIKWYRYKDKRTASRMVDECETAIRELDNIEDFATDFYKRVADSAWGVYVDSHKDSYEYVLEENNSKET